MSVTGRSGGYGGSDTWPKIESEPHAGHSAISLAIAIEGKLSKHQAKYDAQIRNAQKMFLLMAEFVPQRRTGIVPVPEAVVDTWEAVMNDGSCADVELHLPAADEQVALGASGSRLHASAPCQVAQGAAVGTGGGCESVGGSCSSSGPCVVRAHSVVLRRASPVLEALLASPMREGQTGVLRVEGASEQAVRLLLQLVYTGTTTGEDPEVPELLGAMDLAHRWQITHIVDMLEWALAGKVTLGHLNSLCEGAVLKGLPVLRNACRSFAGSSREVQAALNRGELGETTVQELASALGASAGVSDSVVLAASPGEAGTPSLGMSAPPKKKRRLL